MPERPGEVDRSPRGDEQRRRERADAAPEGLYAPRAGAQPPLELARGVVREWLWRGHGGSVDATALPVLCAR